ncbi:hypothetical protein [Listeria sp. PSOL-1]|uniref:hypothetical protein n=1 Tax=Listeria sp. PSOL-1 TaxID=1844999 RepID=UPI0013D69E2D|nr:hypothetical protein [Listeria sp. PSOL-1]
MINKDKFFQDADDALRNRVANIVSFSKELPEQVFKETMQYNFYFYDFYYVIDKGFISILCELGKLLDQQTVKIFTPEYYYKKNQFKINRKRKMPYAKMDINCSKTEYNQILETFVDGENINFLMFDDLYWYFNSECIIYGDKVSEVSVLALDKSLELSTSLQDKLMPVRTFIERQTKMNLGPGIDVDEFKKKLVKNYS